MSALLTVMFADESRQQFELVDDGTAGWLRRGMLEAGDALVGDPRELARSVLIHRLDVYQYNGAETREVMEL